ncbi:MAG: UDP-3-O-[3-hydroxymyristoyl] N-acetylglucosamine deacetylase [Verrucomicrobia bacterium TMED175]|jgi:UDP-3-O-[3-hydroxymyristoyl] N-acetylglucosamine deacetylase|uniref:UDP-3-O-acyl-N-acetylglucosamine deacetylase n=1 Tax=SAR86 cluster bacterium TaxID=2030880 RepID=A0A368BJY0_9GAMM|nr:MAG: UDP-3-O-[3-hydroxymyristoyl] N-acetylglucosamine deacetylase [Verrucomicrobia bacterium TMED175]OUW41248.1 MAG: UDP-3-O-[3-hydroxymyristoyl] N-acetylglucosamine deacetylase [Verrucomicrobia bacterium TMED175]OUX66584.1 MAG: UDP-3-O-[3-hydroxymyristoyl] N-acetylglucosamine deacetylase [Gammaproteobacteria bacterium TMED281]RCL37385.1 MAG: UDP-3-O-acyl-N-acetylglucosamine deacetylase [SAR86 cluster bacterium]|tara:strand:+ start:5622 stop:6536 length:915 start_codon:yes stop_codon:yes gene_type:complete
MLSQRTIRNKITASGVGLHSGKRVNLTFHPAEPNTGVVFRMIDGDKKTEIPAILAHVGDTTLSTSLEKDGYKISTIEHLLSALAGTGVDNCIIDCDGPEIPIMDGSSTQFVFLIQSAGIIEQAAAKKFIYVTKSVQVNRGDAVARIKPYDGFRVTFTLEFDHPVYKKYPQSASIDFSQTSFIREVSRARTFGLMKDLDTLKKNNLALGANLNNAIGIGEEDIENEGGLRFSDEFVKHKILDAIGDLYLLGHNLIGEFFGFKTGHALNYELLKKIESENAYKIIEIDEIKDAPINYLKPISEEVA